jgi:serine/threonine-protein kinase
MEYIEGKTFRKIIEEHPDGVSLKAFCGMIRPVFEALTYAHSRGVVHRDLKPDNLILNKLGSPMIVDFGLSKTSELDDLDNGYITSKGMVLGSPGYMSPEQVTSHPQDHRSDIFSMGVIMYELLNGKNPFLDDSPIASMGKILNEDPLTLELLRPDLPDALIVLITGCLEKDPEKRFSDTDKICREITQIQKQYSS